MAIKGSLEEKSKSLQNGAAESRVKLEQLQTEDEDMRESLNKAQESLEEAKKKIASLESSLTFKSTELVRRKTGMSCVSF